VSLVSYFVLSLLPIENDKVVVSEELFKGVVVTV